MSRIKSRTQSEVCGDCGASDPSWASINRGILLCADCCSIHRSLGRHISQVKSLRQGSWSPSVLNFVNSLNAHGANSVWEHCLMDSVAPKNIRRKPTPKDPLHPVKADFIRAKHVNLSFVLKPTAQQEDTNGGLENELSKQLHASVRSSNLETSLRLLVQGADPNYFHEEKGSTPLHVASKSGQSSQVELLIVYGADLTAPDLQGNRPVDLAKSNKHRVIGDRLVEAMYEVTDRISYFLCGRKPDHSTGQHFVIPEQNNLEISEQLKIARGKLQLVPNRMFEELVMDLYDEVDRRETEAVWATSSLNPETGIVPFLPTNPHLSATRNQGRQKLARFSPTEFAGFLTDVLIDARRRQNMANLRPIDSQLTNNINKLKHTKQLSLHHLQNQQILNNHNNNDLNLSDDEPLYDAVASDDDYAALTPVAQQNFTSQFNNAKGLNTLQKQQPQQQIPNIEIEVLKKELQQSQMTINELKHLVDKLSIENNQLKLRIDVVNVITPVTTPNTPPIMHVGTSPTSNINNNTTPIINDAKSFNLNELPLRDSQINNSIEIENEPVMDNKQNYVKRPVSMYETREGPYNKLQLPDSRTATSMYQMAGNNNIATLPLGEEVTRRTDHVTRRIQELWLAMQDLSKKDSFVPCAERIRVAVAELTTIFPQIINDDAIINAIKHLNINTQLMQNECSQLQISLINDNKQSTELYMQEVRNCAYNLAMATKTLVTLFQ